MLAAETQKSAGHKADGKTKPQEVASRLRMDPNEKSKPKKGIEIKSEDMAKKVMVGKRSLENAEIASAASSSASLNWRVVSSSKAKHNIPPTLGADIYIQTIKKADNYFKMKRYSEAREAYEDLLIIRPNDPHAAIQLQLISKLPRGVIR